MGIWKETAAVSAAALLGLFLLPWALTQGPVKAAELPEAQAAAPPPQEETVSPAQAVHDRERTLRVLDGDAVREMTLADYLVGVTAAEMPASFEPEALKAQAVAARTYTLYKLVSGSNHGDTADICTDSTCCQAYISMENARANWGRSGGCLRSQDPGGCHRHRRRGHSLRRRAHSGGVPFQFRRTDPGRRTGVAE